MVYRLLLFIFVTTFCRAQTPGKTLVFKVRTPAVQCSIECKETFFWLEIENPVTIKVKGGKNVKIKVETEGGQGVVRSVKDDIYNIRFTRPGKAAISVYRVTSFGKELITTKSQEIRNPDIYFCGIKRDSISKYLQLNGPNIYAYSQYYKKQMQVLSFDMYYVEDTILLKKNKVKPLFMKSDTCKLTKEMQSTMLRFQPNKSSIYFYNIICRVPDGSKRILDPIRLDIERDTTDKQKFSLIYSVKKKVL